MTCSHSYNVALAQASLARGFATGGVFTFSKMTCYLNDRNIKLGTLLKKGSLCSSSFTKVLHPIFLCWYYILFFDFWYFEAVRFAPQI